MNISSNEKQGSNLKSSEGVMSLVVCSDAHLDWTTHGVSRFAEVACAMDEAIDKAISLAHTRPTGFLFLGDLSDPEPGSVVYAIQKQLLRMVSALITEQIPQLWLVGNHDVIEDGERRHTMTMLEAFTMRND